MKVLVTGASGFIGRNLTESLEAIRKGYDRTHPELSIDVIYGYDVNTPPELLEEYCRNADFVFHLAGINRPQDPAEFMQGNCGFFSVLLETLKRQHNTCPVMLASSVQATLSGRYAGSAYGESKLAGEQLAFDYSKETGARVLVYRFPNIFGKWCRPQYNSVIATFCDAIAHDRDIQVHDPDTVLTLVYIDDLIEEMLRAVMGQATADGMYYTVPVQHTVTLGRLAEIIRHFEKIRTTGGVPDLADPLVFKLYSTYLSYLPPEKCIYDLPMNCDARGSFTEIIRTTDRGQFSVNISRPGVTKGNHWHHSKNEKFLVVKGEGLIKLRKLGVDKDGKPFPVLQFRVSGNKLQVVEMLPGYTHSLINLSETEDMITFIWANEAFCPEKPDTFFEVVE